MNLIIDGKKAVLKEGSSFEYVSENRSFSDADDYTLSISLPLAGCPENIEIFGHIDRMDALGRHLVFDALIQDSLFSKRGVVTVVEATDSDVKCQFLEGRSVQNFMDDFDDCYINELPLGSYPTATLPESPTAFYSDIDHGADAVALPWVYDGSGDIQNEAVYNKDGELVWSDFAKETGKLSFQPYLIVIAKRICAAIGYTCDFSQWESSPERYLLLCNALPAAWDIPQYARALPHWTLSEFFEELEKILVCEISIDHKARSIALTMCGSIEWLVSPVRLENVLDAFSSEVTYGEELCRFKGIANMRYKERSDVKWKTEQCQWLIDMLKQDGKYYREFATDREWADWAFLTFGPGMGAKYCTRDDERGDDRGLITYIRDYDEYRLLRVVPTVYHSVNHSLDTFLMGWLKINQFGDLIVDRDSGNDIELACVPARLDDADVSHGKCLFLAPSGFDEQEELDDDGIRQPKAYSALLKGEPDDVAEYYDKIYLAYWDGHSSNEVASTVSIPLPPAPYVDERFSLKKRYAGYYSDIRISPREKVKISWLSDVIPDVKAVFHIMGKRYLCEKITATFTENGMSQLLKGEFYPIIDD